MIPRLRPRLGFAEMAAILAPAGSGAVERFEREFAAAMGQRRAVAFPYGRTGLLLLLEAMGLRGKEVVCPAYTCVVVAHAIVRAGCKPVFVDCREGDFNMDLDEAERRIGPECGAIVATSLFGYPVDLDRLTQLRRRHPRVAVIQDCAHSFGAEWKGRPVQKEGRAAFFGLNVSKLLTSIFGGMVTTDDEDLASRLLVLRNERLRPGGWGKSLRRRLYLAAVYPAFWPSLYGLVNRLERLGLLDRFTRYYEPDKIDMPSDYLAGMTGVEARVGLAQLRRYEAILPIRRNAASFYASELNGLPGFVLPPSVPGATYSHYVVRSPRRKEIVEACLRRSVQLGEIVEYSIPEMEAYRDFRRDDFPVSREYSRTVLNLPVWTDDRGVLRRVTRALREASSSPGTAAGAASSRGS